MPTAGRSPGRRGRMERHSGIGFDLVLALDARVLQTVDQLLEVDSFFSPFLPVVAEHIIEVPKITLQDGFLQRVVLIEPQIAEQLVEVPTAPCFVEQNVDTPVGGRGVPGYGGLQGFHPRQGSLQRTVEQTVDIPVPGGGVRDFLPDPGPAGRSV